MVLCDEESHSQGFITGFLLNRKESLHHYLAINSPIKGPVSRHFSSSVNLVRRIASETKGGKEINLSRIGEAQTYFTYFRSIEVRYLPDEIDSIEFELSF